MRRYEGKVCVVTASTAGIGLAIAERLGMEGGTVVVSSRGAEAVDRTGSSPPTLGARTQALAPRLRPRVAPLGPPLRFRFRPLRPQ